MPIAYDYDPETNVLHCRPTDVIDIHDGIAYLNGLIDDETVPGRFIEFVHFGGVVDLKLRFRDMRALVTTYRKLCDAKHPRVTIFIAPSALTYGMANLITSAFPPETSMRVVRSELAANSIMKRYRGDSTSVDVPKL